MEKEIAVNSSRVDNSAVELIYRQLIESWNETNSRAFADLFAKDGSIVGFDGSQANNRNKIFEHLAGIFADHKPAQFVTIVEEIRWLSNEIALLRAVAGMVPRGKKEINPQTNAIQSLIVVEDKDKFRIALFQNTPAAFHGRPELSKELTGRLQKQFETNNKIHGT